MDGDRRGGNHREFLVVAHTGRAIVTETTAAIARHLCRRGCDVTGDRSRHPEFCAGRRFSDRSVELGPELPKVFR